MPPELMEKMEGLRRIAAAITLLRDENLRGFRVDIEVDSTVYGDAAQEKQDRVEFVESVTKFIETAGQIGAQVPQAVPLLGKMIQFAMRGFRVGRDLEASIEDFTDEMNKLAEQHAAAPPQPSPEQIRMQTEQLKASSGMQQTQMKVQADQQKTQATAQQTQVKAQVDQQQQAAEMQRQQVQAQTEQANAQADMQSKAMDLRMREMEMQIEKIRMQADMAKAHAEMHKTTVEALKPPAPPQQASLGKPL